MKRPKLPAIKGFVEVEIDGFRKYKAVETGEIVEPEEIENYKTKDEREIDQLKTQLESIAAAYTEGVNSI